MHLKLQAKLFFALSLLLGVVLVLFVGLSRAGLQRGIGPFVAEVELSRLDWVVDNLRSAYAAHGSWAFLQDDEKQWHALQWPAGSGPGSRGGRPPPAHLRPERPPAPPEGSPDARGRPDAGPRIAHQLDVLPSRIAPPPPPDRRGDRRARADSLYRRLAVLDGAGRVVVGDSRAAQDAISRAVVVDGRTVGSLALVPLEGLGSEANRAFVAQQSGFIAAAGLAGLALALVLSVWLARRWLIGPIDAVVAGAQAVAQGRFDRPVAVRGGDELAQLARSFNGMAGQLAAIEEARQAWLAAAAHELRTPIAALRAEVEALQDGVRTFDAGTADRLHAQVLRLARLVDDLRLVTQETYGAPAALQEPVEPLLLLLDAAQAFEERARDRRLVIEGREGLRQLQEQRRPRVRGDRLRLEQVCFNLLENSLRYTDPDGRIRLAAEVAGQDLVLRVEDSVPAPEPGDLPRLFDRFFRGDASRSRAHGGAGLGLAICRAIVEAHGGRIEAARSALGGLSVTVALPLEPA